MNGQLILDKAGEYLGLKEIPGPAHSDAILGMFERVGHGWVKDDETPWCAAFVGFILDEVGLEHTGKLNARSYLDWGHSIQLADAQPGDVIVLHRKGVNSPYGHVAFFVRMDGPSSFILRGGNQGNAVSDQTYSVSRLLDVRRFEPHKAHSKPAPEPRNFWQWVMGLFKFNRYNGSKTKGDSNVTRSSRRHNLHHQPSRGSRNSAGSGR